MLCTHKKTFHLCSHSRTEPTSIGCQTYMASVDIFSPDVTYSLDRGLPMGSPKAAAGPLKQKIGSP